MAQVIPATARDADVAPARDTLRRAVRGATLFSCRYSLLTSTTIGRPSGRFARGAAAVRAAHEHARGPWRRHHRRPRREPQAWSRRVHPLRRDLLACLLIIVATAIAISVAVIDVVSTIAGDLALGGKPISSTELTAASAGAAQTIMVDRRRPHRPDDHLLDRRRAGSRTASTCCTPTPSCSCAWTPAEPDVDPLDPARPARQLPLEGPVLPRPEVQRHLLARRRRPRPEGRQGDAARDHDQPRDRLQLRLVPRPGGRDRLRLHRRRPPLLNAPGGSYQPINVQPGYQRLCGENALAYVRYRHTDSDFVRVARQQDFIRQAKEQLGVLGLPEQVRQAREGLRARRRHRHPRRQRGHAAARAGRLLALAAGPPGRRSTSATPPTTIVTPQGPVESVSADAAD